MPVDANPAVESSPTEFVETSLESLTDEQSKHWRLTGELPKQTEAAPVEPPEEAPAEAGKPEGTQEAGKAKGIKTRKVELDAEIQELEARLARKADLKRQLSETGEKPPAPPPVDKPAELKAPVKPKQADFQTWEEYESATDKYHDEMSDFKITLALQKDRAERAKEAEAAKAKTEGETVAQRFNQQVEAAAKKHSDWNEVAPAIGEILKDPRYNAGAGFILESEQGAEITYYLGTHLDEAATIAKMSPIRQCAALGVIEHRLSQPAAEPKKAAPGPKKETEVPPPPTELGGRNALPADPVNAALESGDTGAYIRAANARDLAERRSGQR